MPLTEARRKQLDAIVVQLADQDAPEEDVRTIVEDFKSKYGNEQAPAPKEPSLGERALKAIVPGVDQPLPETGTRTGVNPMTGAREFFGTSDQVPLNRAQQAGAGFGRVVGGALGAVDRGIGAALNQGEDKGKGYVSGFLDRMGDESAGALKFARDAANRSSLPQGVKTGIGVATSIAESAPGIALGVGMAGAASKVNKAIKVGSQAVKASDEVVQAASLGGRAGTASGVVEVPLTKGQQAAVGGVPEGMDIQKVAKFEAGVKGKHPGIWEEFTKGQNQAVSSKVSDIRTKRGFESTPAPEIEKDVVSTILDRAEMRKLELKAEYNKLEAVGNSKPLIDNPMIDAAFKEMDKHNFYPTRLTEVPGHGRMITVPQFVKTKQVKRTDVVLGAVPGEQTVPTFKAGGEVVEEAPMVPRKFVSDRMEDVVVKVERDGKWTNGVSQKAAEGVTEARKIVDDNMTYSGLKSARTKIRTTKSDLFRGEGVGPQDAYVLDEIYQKLTHAMEEQIRVTWGEQAVKTWKATDALYSKKDDFVRLQKILNSNEPETAIRNLTRSPKAENLEALRSVKSLESEGVLPEGTFHTLQNASFNKIIERSTKNGVVDGDLLLAQVKKMPVEHYNTVFSGGLEDDMAELVMQAIGTKLAQRRSFPINNPGAALQAVKDIGGHAGILTLMTLGRKAFATVKIGQFLTSFMAARSPKAAADYLRNVDEKSLTAAFFKGQVIGGSAAQSAEAVAAPAGAQD